jgi:hypothetical protein
VSRHGLPERADSAKWPEKWRKRLAIADKDRPHSYHDGKTRLPDDCMEMRDFVYSSEAPGIVAGLVSDDHSIRARVQAQDLASLGRTPPEEKMRMIKTLLNGYIDDMDVVAIDTICRRVFTPDEMAQLRARFGEEPHVEDDERSAASSRARRAQSHLSGACRGHVT